MYFLTRVFIISCYLKMFYYIIKINENDMCVLTYLLTFKVYNIHIILCVCIRFITVGHIEITCPKTKFIAVIKKLHRPESEAIMWLENLELEL